MIKPMCRFCNTRHHFREDHAFEGAKPDMANSMANSMANTKDDVANKKTSPILSTPQSIKLNGEDSGWHPGASRTYQYRSIENRKAYMKEYMAKNRAAKKGDK